MDEPSRYRARLIARAKATEPGLAYEQGDERALLAWGRVLRAFAAEVGEPEGIRALVFDLVVGLEGTECLALRFDAEPGEAAREVARAIVRGVGSERCDAALLEVAERGYALDVHPDLAPFDEACLEAMLRKAPVRTTDRSL